MGCDTSCVNEHRFKQIEEDLKQLRERNSVEHKEFYNRIEKTEKDMVESESDRKHINVKLDEIDANVKSLMQKPEKRYDAIVTGIITTVIGVIIGFLLNGVIPM